MVEQVFDVFQTVFADIVLSGDNALMIGIAAAPLRLELRKKEIFMGVTLTAGLRMFFTAMAIYLLAIAFMVFFATMIMKVMSKYTWLSWPGLVFLLSVQLHRRPTSVASGEQSRPVASQYFGPGAGDGS